MPTVAKFSRPAAVRSHHSSSRREQNHRPRAHFAVSQRCAHQIGKDCGRWRFEPQEETLEQAEGRQGQSENRGESGTETRGLLGGAQEGEVGTDIIRERLAIKRPNSRFCNIWLIAGPTSS